MMSGTKNLKLLQIPYEKLNRLFAEHWSPNIVYLNYNYRNSSKLNLKFYFCTLARETKPESKCHIWEIQ